MKVICKENFGNNPEKRVSLIIGKVYDGRWEHNYFRTIDEVQIVYSFPSDIFGDYFYTFDEWRDLQINSILDE